MLRWVLLFLILGGAVEAGQFREALRAAERGRNWEAALEAAEAMAAGAPRGGADAAHAAWRRAEALGHANRQEEAEAAFAAFSRDFDSAAAPDVEAELASGLAAHGEWLGNRGRFPEAAERFEAVIARYGERADPRFDPPLSKAMGMRAAALGRLGQTGPAMQAIVDAEQRFGASADPQVQANLVITMMVRGMMQSDAKQEEAALSSFDRVIERFGSSPEAEVRQVAMAATLAKMASLVTLERMDEARAVGRAVLESITEDMPRELKETAAPIAFMMIALELADGVAAAVPAGEDSAPPSMPAPEE